MPPTDPARTELARNPRRRSITWTVRAPLARWLEAEAARAAADLGPYRVLDVGCGFRPYEPYFAPHATEYVGVDVDNPAADLQGVVESLPVPDASFDVVLCTQVLEHSTDPSAAIRELRRVCRRRARARLDARDGGLPPVRRTTSGAGRTPASGGCSPSTARGRR